MKTTIDVPDDILKAAKATAALRGASLKDFVTEALEEHLKREDEENPTGVGWRAVFGLARPSEVDSVDRIVEEGLEGVDPAEWK